MAQKTIIIFDKVNKDPKEAWFSTSLSNVNNRINSAGIPTNAVISKVRMRVNADFDGGGVSAKVYLRFGFGSQGSISTSLMGDTRIDKELYNYPSDTGVEISSTYIKTTSPFGFKDSIGANFVAYIYTANILVTELTVNSAEVVVDYEIPNYTITWKDIDGKGGSTTTTVARGTVPTYSGTPTKAPTLDTEYKFSSWNTTPVAATANATYTAQFTSSTRMYEVKIECVPENGTGQSCTVAGGGKYAFNAKVSPSASNIPKKHRFKNWEIYGKDWYYYYTNPFTFTIDSNITADGAYSQITVKCYIRQTENKIIIDTSPSSELLLNMSEAFEAYKDLTKVYG